MTTVFILGIVGLGVRESEEQESGRKEARKHRLSLSRFGPLSNFCNCLRLLQLFTPVDQIVVWLGWVAAFTRSHMTMNGLIPFKKAIEQTKETMSLTHNNNSYYTATINRITSLRELLHFPGSS